MYQLKTKKLFRKISKYFSSIVLKYFKQIMYLTNSLLHILLVLAGYRRSMRFF